MKKIFFMTLLCAAIVLTGCGGDKRGDSKNTSIKYDKVLVIGVDDAFPPICFRDESGEIVGFDVDLARETARRMGYKIEFKPIDWANKEHEITSGNVDMIWNGCDITEERKKYMTFGKPYMDNRQILVVRRGNDKNIYTKGDLEGKVVGTQAGSSSVTYIKDDPTLRDTFAEFKIYHDSNEGFKLLSEGELDVLIIAEIAGRYEAIKHPDMFEPVEVTIGPTAEFGVGYRKNSEELRYKVQKAFDSMLDDGTAKRISEKWFNADLIKYIR